MTDPVGVVDPEGQVHHEFADLDHGRKVDYDKIVRGTGLYLQWISLYARTIDELYPGSRRPNALVGIANGANRVAVDAAYLLGGGMLGLETVKIGKKEVAVDPDARTAILSGAVKFALTVEDVGTTGGTTATAILDLRSLGVPHIEAMNGHQRTDALPRLDELGVTHHSLILDTSLPTYTPQQCTELTEGYCHQKVPLIRHGS